MTFRHPLGSRMMLAVVHRAAAGSGSARSMSVSFGACVGLSLHKGWLASVSEVNVRTFVVDLNIITTYKEPFPPTASSSTSFST